MPSAVTVAVLGARDVAKELGKKGTGSDITLFNSTHDDRAVTFVEPTQFPEKLAPLLTAVAMADRAVLVVPGLSREVAETAAVLDLVPTPVEVRLGPGVGADEVRRAFKGTRLETLPMPELDLRALRAEAEGWNAPPRDGPVRVTLDHAFPVKGVGAVALGFVGRGTVRAHDRLRLYPTDRAVEVRSIQVHDVDVREAATGSRVGLALKGIDADELVRGQVLAPDGSLAVSERLTGRESSASRYFRGTLAAGAHLHAQVGLQFVPVEVRRFGADGFEVEADRPVAFEPGASALVADLTPPKGPRIAARLTLDGPPQA